MSAIYTTVAIFMIIAMVGFTVVMFSQGIQQKRAMNYIHKVNPQFSKNEYRPALTSR